MKTPTQCVRSEALLDSGLIRTEQSHFPPELRSGEYFFNFVQSKSAIIPCSPHSPKPCRIGGFDPGAANRVTYDEAVSVYKQSQQKYSSSKSLSGVMIATGSVEDLVVISMDNVIDPETAYIDPSLRELLVELDDTFWEVSRSGTGINGYILDNEGVDPEIRSDGVVEAIDDTSVAITGQHINRTSKTLARCSGTVNKYQAKYKNYKSSTSSATPDNKNSTSRAEKRAKVLEARKMGLDKGEFEDILGRTEEDLNDRERRVVTAMCRSNPKAKQLWKNGHDAQSAVDKKSRNDSTLMNRLAWWGREADRFDFELSQAEVEHLFLASPLGKRDKIKRPERVSLIAYNEIWPDAK